MTDKQESLLNVAEAAKFLNCGISTLNKLRVVGGGPVFVKMGARVAYARDDLDRYISKCRRKSTAEHKGKAA
jgi:hypothetical protein